MTFTTNIVGQVAQIVLPKSKALWPLFETVVNSIQSLEDTGVDEPTVQIVANHSNGHQINADGGEEPSRFDSFIVIDNGEGFTTRNYKSFLEAYSTLKIAKGCKGIGRFLWLKAFDQVRIESVFCENEKWYERSFSFDLTNTISPEENVSLLDDSCNPARRTVVNLLGFSTKYQEEVAYSLESLAKKIIEHCLIYFITGNCPHILLQDNEGESFDLNEYFQNHYKDTLHHDTIHVVGNDFTLYHMTVPEGADKHELHFCANNREVVTYDLSKWIPNLEKKIVSENSSFYYIGYLTGEYLDSIVNAERTRFEFADAPLLHELSGQTSEQTLVTSAIDHIKLHLSDDLQRISASKKSEIDQFVHAKKPQYRFLLNQKPEVYDEIPVGLSGNRLDLELYKHEQRWEAEVAQQGVQIEEHDKNDMQSPEYESLFQQYCSSVTKLSQASLAEYIVRRKTVIDLLGKALELSYDGTYSRESQIHSIICPMQTTSDEIPYNDMNLWLIDDRLAYHQYLASDKPMKSLPVVESDSPDRMDIAVFDRPLSYSSDSDELNSITIIELKRPQRNDMTEESKSPISQVLRYVAEIKAGRVKKANGRGFGDVTNAAFYCYIIADLTPSLITLAEEGSLIRTPDHEGFFGFNNTRGAYIEVISYDKLLRNAKKRNQVLFDRLFRAKASDVQCIHLDEKV